MDAATRGRVLQALDQRRVEATTRTVLPQALSSTDNVTTARVVFLGPGELAAYRVSKDIGRGLRELGQAVGKAGQVRQMVTDLDKQLAASRRAF